MSGGETIYQRICRSGNLDSAVSKLEAGELTELAEYLAGMGVKGGIPAQVMGMVSARLSEPAAGNSKRRKKS